MKKCFLMILLFIGIAYNNSTKPMTEQEKQCYAQTIAQPVFQLSRNTFFNNSWEALGAIKKNVDFVRADLVLRFATNASLTMMKKRIPEFKVHANPKAVAEIEKKIKQVDSYLKGESLTKDDLPMPSKTWINNRQKSFLEDIESAARADSQ